MRIRSAFLAAILALFGLLGALASPVAASESCPAQSTSVGSGTTWAVLYANGGYGTPALCVKAGSTSGTAIVDLDLIGYDWGTCPGQGPFSGTGWNDCISSIKASVDCHHTFSLYADSNYGSLMYSTTTTLNVSSMSLGYNDTASSVKIGYHSACITSPTG